MSEFLEVASGAFATKPNQIVRHFEFQGEKFWVKRPRQTGARGVHRLAYKIFGHPLLVPPLGQSPQQALAHEVGKLLRLQEKGINVPCVVAKNHEMFVLEDGGASVLYAIRKQKVSDVLGLLEKVVVVLAALHVKGEFHGGAQIKNFTCKEEKVFAIDFEEAFDGQIPLGDLQFRDLFLFLFSLAKHDVETDYVKLISLYEEHTNNGAAKRVKSLAKSLGGVTRLAHTPLIQKLLDQDSKSAFRLLRILGALEEEA